MSIETEWFWLTKQKPDPAVEVASPAEAEAQEVISCDIINGVLSIF